MTISRVKHLQSINLTIPNRKLCDLSFASGLLNLTGQLKVEDSKLIEAFYIADPKIKLPSRHTVTRDIKKLYNKKRLEFDQKVSKIEHFAGNNDAGSSSNSR